MLDGGDHACRENPFTFSASPKNQRSQICTYQTESQIFYWSLVHFLLFLAQTNLFRLLIISGVFTAIWLLSPNPHSFLWVVDVLRCALLELWVAFIWALIWGAVTQILAVSEAADSDGFCSLEQKSLLVLLSCGCPHVTQSFCIFTDCITFISFTKDRLSFLSFHLISFDKDRVLLLFT